MTASRALPDSFPFSELAAGAGGAAATQIAHWWLSRRKVRADTFKTVVDTLQLRLGKTEERLDLVEAQHETCERELHAVNAKLDEAKREIDRLMRGPIAGYQDKAPE